MDNSVITQPKEKGGWHTCKRLWRAFVAKPSGDRKGWQRFMDFIEQPLFLAVVSIIGGIVAVTVYPPIFVLSVICILLALHRSKALAGLRPVVQVAWYILVFVLSTAILVWVGREVRGSARAFMRDLAAAVVQAIKPQLPTAPDPASKSGNNLQLPTAAQIAEEVTKRLPTTNTAPKVELPLAVEFHIASPKIITVLNHGREIQDVRLRLTEYGYAAEAPWSDIPATKDKPAIIHKPPKRVTFYQLQGFFMDLPSIPANTTPAPLDLWAIKSLGFVGPGEPISLSAIPSGAFGFYALRFTFRDPSSGKRYAYTRIISTSKYGWPPDDPENTINYSSTGALSHHVFEDMVKDMLNHQKELYASGGEEEYKP